LPFLRGDSTKIRKELGWKPDYTFQALMEDMVDHWLPIISRNVENQQANL